MTTFNELGLDPLLLQALETEGYTTPTPIQAQAIPSILAGKDLLGIAQTGTGKTAAFALPILQRLAANRQPALRKGVRALILSPTRELATQIGESFRTYGRHMGLSVAVVFGGVAHKPQRDALNRGVDILVATPGRLIDHMTERNVVLDGTEILVLDEADQMMDLGFIRPLRQIIAKLSHRRQSLFFSATMPHEIGALAAELLKDPVKVSVAPVAKTADRVAQEVIFIEQTKKRALLVELFANPDMKRAIVFTRTKRGADRVARHLETAGIPVAAIHGNKSQGQRDAALKSFKAGRIRALIATDIAARGIDIDAVSHVVNYEIPNIPESYVHRIGRTARAGAEGIAISLVDNEERAYLRDIERLTRLQIPSKDRRGDNSLVAPVETRSSRDAESADRNDRRGSPRSHRNRDAGRGDARPNSRGEARQNSRGEARDNNRDGARQYASGGGRPHARGEDARHGGRDAHRANGGDQRREARSYDPLEQRPRTRDDRSPHRGEKRTDGRDHANGRRQDQDRSAHEHRGHADNGGQHGHARNGNERNGGKGPHRADRPHRDGEHGRSHGRAHDRPQSRPNERDSRSGATGQGLEGVKFLSKSGDHPRGTRSGPRPNDRLRARPRPA